MNIVFIFLFNLCYKDIVEKEAPSLMKEAERFLILSNIDRLWKEHLQAIKFVQQAVGLRGYAQRDPLIEYKLEGYNLFLEMMAQIRRNVIYSIYQVCTKVLYPWMF
jgi:preprotein translocase subunit SecA